MARHAIVNAQGVVVNIVDWEGAEWLPPRGHLIVASEVCDVDDLYDDETKVFTKNSNGKRYHKDCTKANYKAGIGFIE